MKETCAPAVCLRWDEVQKRWYRDFLWVWRGPDRRSSTSEMFSQRPKAARLFSATFLVPADVSVFKHVAPWLMMAGTHDAHLSGAVAILGGRILVVLFPSRSDWTTRRLEDGARMMEGSCAIFIGVSLLRQRGRLAKNGLVSTSGPITTVTIRG